MFNSNFNRLFNELFRMSDFSFDTKNLEKKVFKSDDGSLTLMYYTTKSNKTEDNDEVSELKSELETVVESQDFEKAVELRDKIKVLEKNKSEITKLESELDECIKTQNFEKAIELRDKIKSLK